MILAVYGANLASDGVGRLRSVLVTRSVQLLPIWRYAEVRVEFRKMLLWNEARPDSFWGWNRRNVSKEPFAHLQAIVPGPKRRPRERLNR